jgi:dTMP kinase
VTRAGAYFVLEGPDGCGKSEQAQRLVGWVRSLGREALHVREPGSTPVGEALRALLLDPASGALEPITEALLFFAARAELVQRQIAPALSAGTVVVAERSFVSTLVYQGAALGQAGVPPDLLERLIAATHRGALPTRVFVLDVAPTVAAARRGAAAADRFEARGAGFQERVRQGFLDCARRLPYVEVVDGARSRDEVHAALRGRAQALLEPS